MQFTWVNQFRLGWPIPPAGYVLVTTTDVNGNRAVVTTLNSTGDIRPVTTRSS